MGMSRSMRRGLVFLGINELKLTVEKRDAVLCYGSGRLTGDEEKESEREEEMVLSYDERLD